MEYRVNWPIASSSYVSHALKSFRKSFFTKLSVDFVLIGKILQLYSKRVREGNFKFHIKTIKSISSYSCLLVFHVDHVDFFLDTKLANSSHKLICTLFIP